MVTDILNKMAEIVDNTMTSFQSDFEKYDRPYIEAATPEQFPMLWLVATSHTHLLKLGDYHKRFFNEEAVRYAYAVDDDTFSCYLNICHSDKVFLIDANSITEITHSQAKEAVRDIVVPVVTKWTELNGPLPTDIRMPIKFHNITLSKLKDLIRDCEKHDNTSLVDIFYRFRNYYRHATDQYIQISYNPGYNEFVFCQYTNGKQGLVGGIIFHGWPESGYQANGSIQLEPRYGWATHT